MKNPASIITDKSGFPPRSNKYSVTRNEERATIIQSKPATRRCCRFCQKCI